jgi:hypothetical protein
MDNNLPPVENLSMSALSAMNSVKEEKPATKHYSNKLILITMIIFVTIVVGISIINFGAFITQESIKATDAQNSHNKDVQKLTNQ